MSKAKIRTLLILLGVLAAVCVAAFCISRHEEKQEEIRTSDEIILTIPTDSVTALSWEYGDTALGFHRDDDGWKWDDDEAFPVDGDKVDALLEQFASFGVAFAIDNVTDYAQYGLDEPTAVIRITTEDGEQELKLGTFSTMDEERYITLGEDKVYLASHDPLEEYDVTISDLILHDTMPTLSEADDIVFTGSQDYEITRDEESDLSWCDDDVYFTEEKPLSTSAVSSFLKSATGLTLSDYVSYNVTEEELEAYGLATPELTIAITYTVTEKGEDGEEDTTREESLTLHVGRNQEEISAAEATAEESGEEPDLSGVTCYARVGESQIVYEITASAYEKLMANSYDDLRHQEICTVSMDDVTRMDVTLEGETYTLSAVTDEEGNRTWYLGDVPAAEETATDDADAETAETPATEDTEDAEATSEADAAQEVSISGISSALSALKATSFVDEADPGREEISITLSLSKEAWPQVTVTLYRVDGSSCLAKVNGQVVAYVDRDQVVDLVEAVNQIVLN